MTWKRSSACSFANCVEVLATRGHVLVRDSKNPAAGALAFTPEEWTAFVAGVRAGEFDLPFGEGPES